MKKVLTLLAATTALSACKYNVTDSNNGLTEEQVKLIIDNYVEENPDKIIQEVNNYMAKMQAKQQEDEMAKMFENPVEFKLDAATPIKGAKDAVITIVDFSDFECPFCQRVNPTLDAILKRYDGKVKLAFKHLPLNFHQNAKPAAYASIAAHNQGKFWEFHDALFANQQNLTQEVFIKEAKKLGLNIAKFKTDMAAKATIEKVEFDLKQAQEMGIGGTPYFLINGVPVSGALPEAEFAKVIEKLLSQINK